ncbi:MAG: hypothetical protein Q7R30_17600 [Acidobacteriota bacterium]|nr:hypothetical protein [Acidobacteriota bacterium]
MSATEMAVVLGCRLTWGECAGTLAQVPLAGGAPREILKDVLGADWSPDGRTLAAVAVAGGAYRLHYPIGKVLYEAPGWITSPRVSPKGDLVAFLDHPTLGNTRVGELGRPDRKTNDLVRRMEGPAGARLVERGR